MNLYLASTFPNKQFIRITKELIYLKFNDIIITSRWIDETTIGGLKFRAKVDYEDIDNADVLLAIYPFVEGTNSEMGYALGKGKKVLLLIDQIYFNKDGLRNPLHNKVEPLPAGKLDYYYDSNFKNYKGNKDYLNDSFGFILYNYEEMIECLDFLQKIY